MHLITLIDTHNRQDSSGRGVRLLTTQHFQQTDIYALGEIRTRNPNKRAAADPLLRSLGHCDGQLEVNIHNHGDIVEIFVYGRQF